MNTIRQKDRLSKKKFFEETTYIPATMCTLCTYTPTCVCPPTYAPACACGGALDISGLFLIHLSHSLVFLQSYRKSLCTDCFFGVPYWIPGKPIENQRTISDDLSSFTDMLFYKETTSRTTGEMTDGEKHAPCHFVNFAKTQP